MPDRSHAATALLLPVLLVGCASSLPASRPDAGAAARPPAIAAAPVTVVGTLVDSHCYSIDRAHVADDHRTPGGTIEGCAKACATMGIPVALLTASGEVVVLLVPSPDLADHMGQEARAVGTRALQGSLRPDSLFVRGDGGTWTPISLHQMM